MAMETGFVDDVRTPENPYESPKPEGTPVEQWTRGFGRRCNRVCGAVPT
jgi:hypothetical protein